MGLSCYNESRQLPPLHHLEMMVEQKFPLSGNQLMQKKKKKKKRRVYKRVETGLKRGFESWAGGKKGLPDGGQKSAVVS
jgi:hypothetical protein